MRPLVLWDHHILSPHATNALRLTVGRPKRNYGKDNERSIRLSSVGCNGRQRGGERFHRLSACSRSPKKTDSEASVIASMDFEEKDEEEAGEAAFKATGQSFCHYVRGLQQLSEAQALM
mmetsp:Transcript_10033/g.21178  ORF Transcript_10033/g.21178 Transcript_10033/m.21178 type:complete len:119 (-) Transcript_10033:382-738(-)